MDRLKTKEIQEAKEIILAEQGGECPLCLMNMQDVPNQNICLDHSHINGQIRAVLCRNCNAIEGRIWNFSNRAKRDRTIKEWLEGLIEYIDYHDKNPSDIYHPNYRTEEEKRIRRNKKAKKARDKKKLQNK